MGYDSRVVLPSRRQKRWSTPFRTFGALFLLLGGVGLLDSLLGLASRTSHIVDPLDQKNAPLAWILPLLGLGGVLFVLGNHWREK